MLVRQTVLALVSSQRERWLAHVRRYGDPDLATRSVGGGSEGWRQLLGQAASGDAHADELVGLADTAAAEHETHLLDALEDAVDGEDTKRGALDAARWLLEASRPERYARSARDAVQQAAQQAAGDADVRRRVLVAIARSPEMSAELEAIRATLAPPQLRGGEG